MAKKTPRAIFTYNLSKSSSDKGVNQKLDTIITLLKEVLRMKPETRAALDRLEAAVAEDTNVTNSVVTLLQGLAAQIAELKNGVEDPAILAALDAAVDIVASNTKKTADAVVANTPA